jgi:hypothetical protein
MKRSEHPKSCAVCHGTGWAEVATATDGKPLFTPCDHHWSNDEPELEEYLAADDPRAIAAFERGYRQGQHELYLTSDGRLGQHLDGRRGTMTP